MEPRKRHLEFLEFLPQLVSLVPDVRVVFAGEGQSKSAIEERVAELKLCDHVCFLGFRHDPERIIALADVCILTSVREGLPRVLLQYLAGGRAVVVSDLPGLGEIVINGRNAFVIPSPDLHTVVVKISELLQDSVSRSILETNARNTDLTTWDVNVMCERIESIYREAHRAVAPMNGVAG
jgi:glycosyltransferase involved in cell wall biosynthesis